MSKRDETIIVNDNIRCQKVLNKSLLWTYKESGKFQYVSLRS